MRPVSIAAPLLLCLPCAALEFDATNDKVEATYGSVRTVAVWVNRRSTGSLHRTWEWGGNRHTSWISGPAGDVTFWYTLSIPNVAGGAPDNQWTHIVCTVDASGPTGRTYINGVHEQFGTVSAINDAAGLMTIASTSNVQWFDGWMDDFRVYNRELSAAEIRALYLATRNRARKRVGGTLAQGLITHYEFRDGRIGTAASATLKSTVGTNNGTPFGDPVFSAPAVK